jgi:hypothetical protein
MGCDTMSAANEGLPLEGLINPIPKRKRYESLLVRFHEIEHSRDLDEMIECCFDAGAKTCRVEAKDYEEAEIALIKITTLDSERFLIDLNDTDAKGYHDVVWRTK